MVKRRFNSEDYDEYGYKGEKIVIGLDDIRDVFKSVIKKELVDKLEKEVKKRIIKKLY